MKRKQELIKETPKSTAEELTERLKTGKVLKYNMKNIFQKTEQLEYYYQSIKSGLSLMRMTKTFKTHYQFFICLEV